MGITVVKTLIARCEYCNHKERYEGTTKFTLPKGWGHKDHICYGSDHYYKDGYWCTKLACPACMINPKKGTPRPKRK